MNFSSMNWASSRNEQSLLIESPAMLVDCKMSLPPQRVKPLHLQLLDKIVTFTSLLMSAVRGIAAPVLRDAIARRE